MLARLFLAFTIIPLVEIYLLVRVGSHIGALPTVALVVGTGMAGAWLARAQGLSVMARIRENMNRGVPPTGELVDALLIFIAGVLLITPGLITDTVGLLLLVPPARRAVRTWLAGRFVQWTAQGRVHVVRGPGASFGGPFGDPFGGPRGGAGPTRREVHVINSEPTRSEPARPDPESDPESDKDERR